MPITQTLRMAIIDCLAACPGIEKLDGRRALVAQADLDAELAKRITYGGPVRSFCALLVADLEEYGRLEDGYHPLQAIMDAVHECMDAEGRRECNLISADLRLQLAIAGIGELIRTRWYVLLSGLAFGAILLFAVGYVLPAVGEPVLESSTPDALSTTGVELFTPTPIKGLVAEARNRASGQTATAALEVPPPTLAADATTPSIVQPSPTYELAAMLTPTPRAGATVLPTEPPLAIISAATQPSATDVATPTILSSSETPTSLPPYTALASATATASPRATNTPGNRVPARDGLQRAIRLDAPETALRSIQGDLTLDGLAIECLDAGSVSVVDERGLPIRMPLQGMQGVYTLPEGTKKVLLWVDSRVYGDWWNYYDTQAEDTVGQDSIVLRVVQRSSAAPARGLPDRRWKTPESSYGNR